MSLSGEGAFAVRVLQISVIYLLCLLFMLACSAEEQDTLAGDELEENELQDTEDPTQPIDYNQMDVEELKKQAIVYTFEDIKSMTLEQINNIHPFSKPIPVVWFKDFKQWDLRELNTGQISELLQIFHYYNLFLTEDNTHNHIYINNDEIINNLTLDQFNTTVNKIYADRESEFSPLDLCFGSHSDQHFFGTNYYSIEYIKQLSSEHLYLFRGCLRLDQLMALNNEQIIESKNFSTDDGSIPFSPERLKSFGNGIAGMRGREFRKLNQNQVSALTPEQIGLARYENRYDDFEWSWHPKQMVWMSSDQIGGLIIDERTRIHREHTEVLSAEQLRGFSLDQTTNIKRYFVSLFSPEQLRVLKENGTANESMERAIYYQDLGEDIFSQYPFSVNSDIPHFELIHYIPSLLPVQFGSIRITQIGSLPFSTPLELSPEQISNFPYLILLLNFLEHQLESERYTAQYKEETEGWRSGYDYLQIVYEREKKLLDRYGTLNHLELLDKEQVQAIPPEQIQHFPPPALNVLYKRNFNQEEYKYFRHASRSKKNRKVIPLYKGDIDRYDFEENSKYSHIVSRSDYEAPYEVPLTLEQFAVLTLEQFKAIFFGLDTTWEEEVSHLTDEYFNALSVEKIDFLMEHIDPSMVFLNPQKERVLVRKRELELIQKQTTP